MDIERKFNLITRNLQEVIGTDELKNILKDSNLNIYWGTAPTGRIHIGYFIQLLKIADYLEAGCKVKILIADLHAFLDNLKTNMEKLKLRTEYYILMIKEILISLNINIEQLEFIIGSSYQLSNDYTLDVYKLNSLVSLSEAKHAGAEVVKQTSNPLMTGLLYPTLQALDEKYLNVNAQTGGIDQRKIFMFARKYLPQIGYKKNIHLMTPMVQGLRFCKKEDIIEENIKEENIITKQDKLKLLNLEVDLPNHYVDTLYEKYINTTNITTIEKMSSSDINSKIDLLDTKNEIKKKINKAYCFPQDIEDNCLLDLLDKVIFNILAYKNKQFVINRLEKYGGLIVYDNIETLKDDFKNGLLYPQDLKLGIIDNLNDILEPIRNAFSTKERMLLIKKAYS